MKHAVLISLSLVFFSCLLVGQSKKGKEVTISGEVIDVQCYVSGAIEKSLGEDHKECAISCSKGGIPLAILEDKTGTIYLAGQTKSSMKGANEMLIPFIAEKVRVTGRVQEKGGMKLLLISKIAGQSQK